MFVMLMGDIIVFHNRWLLKCVYAWWFIEN